ncbi:hypothetical protein [Clostridium aminobutyricum]|uniref:Uncharacterized protein n=1 Tax=Clostridium aminobutyricum TaxID=33953 RepID=A0A939IGE5_CLOAM|nr:hypothetical protein [Clostridium aminobutyricum]MBN7773185.1 hypothetical protein [Clostridium aminobutyricum]
MQNQNGMKDLDRATNNLIQANVNGNLTYPEVYYRVQPFVMCICDQMDSYGMISQDMLEQATETIYNNVWLMHPDLMEYADPYNAMKSDVETQQRNNDYYRDRGRNFSPGYGGFRRRGLFQDFIYLLLLNEVFRRGRTIY